MDFSEEVEALLQDKDYDGALGLVFNPDNQPKVYSFGMDLITRICEYGLAFCPEVDSLVACQDMLMHVVRTVRPKEALISLLEQAEMFVHYESSKFSSLLAPLQHVMLNLPKKREHSFSWVLSILNSHIKSQHKFPLDLKKTKFPRGREAQLLLEQHQKIKDTILIYNQYCNFYDPFVRQFWVERGTVLSLPNGKDTETEAVSSILRQQDILRDHLVQLLGDPLLHFDLYWDANNQSDAVSQQIQKSDARLVTERLMGFLRLVDQYPTYYCEWSNRKLYLEKSTSLSKNKPIYCGPDDDNESDDGDSDDCLVDFSSVVHYYYLIHVEGLNKDLVPSVFSPSHMFISTVRLVYPILSDDKAGPTSLLKCFLLAQKLLGNIDGRVQGIRLDAHLLETSDITDFIETVAYHTVYCPDTEVRKEGLQVLRKFMWKFEPKGQYDFVLFVCNRIEHDGVKGYIITQLKDCIRLALDRKEDEMLGHFTGKPLVKQLRLTCFLKNGVTTDLMENKEQIISALNLFLYLAIRDKTGSLTGILGILPEIQSKLLDPLYKALELSRAHYQLKLKELADPATFEQQLKEQKKLNENMDVVLKNDADDDDQSLSPESIRVSMEEQKRAVNTALGVFDVMNGVLARVSECCDMIGKTSKK